MLLFFIMEYNMSYFRKKIKGIGTLSIKPTMILVFAHRQQEMPIIKMFSRNQDSGKVFFLEKQEYVDSCKTHDIRLLSLLI